jgi:hypothetical protein
MKHRFPVMFALMAMAVLLGMGSMLNSACKTGAHAWCDPTVKIRQSATQSQQGHNLNGHAVARVRLSAQR